MIGWNSEKAARALRRTAETALVSARKNCPVRTGRLKSSLTCAVEGEQAVVSANTDYAVYVELGTGRTLPNPFLQNALYEAAGKAGKIYLEEMFRNG